MDGHPLGMFRLASTTNKGRLVPGPLSGKDSQSEMCLKSVPTDLRPPEGMDHSYGIFAYLQPLCSILTIPATSKPAPLTSWFQGPNKHGYLRSPLDMQTRISCNPYNPRVKVSEATREALLIPVASISRTSVGQARTH